MPKYCTYSLVSTSSRYQAQYKVLRKSLDKYLPDWDHVLVTYREHSDILRELCTDRPRVAKNILDSGYDGVLHLGADNEFFNRPERFLSEIDKWESIMFPHSNYQFLDDRYPNESSILRSGLINSDLVFFKNSRNSLSFLNWQSSQIQRNIEGTFLDQSWLQFAVCYTDCLVLRDPAYNVAYYNLHEKERVKMVKNYVDKGTTNMVSFQYSGLDFDKLDAVSVHTNRRFEEQDSIIKFLQAYKRRVSEAY